MNNITTTLEQRIEKLEKQLNQLNGIIQSFNIKVNKSATQTDLITVEKNIKDILNVQNNIIKNIEQKLTTVSTPAQTTFYLEQTELIKFRQNFSQVQAMLATLENLYKTLTAQISSQT